jgi:lysylphosphatidylglycerol synthetase-like protein (DUF2156 family)
MKMKQLDISEIYPLIQTKAHNSSHQVWLWSSLSFYRSSKGWIFGVTIKFGVVIFALEPLPPENFNELEAPLTEALDEVKSYFGSAIFVFVGVNTPYAQILSNCGYKSLQIGKEPWINLEDIKPTGHQGRKIRAAVNQATKSGTVIEKFLLSEIHQNIQLKNQIESLKKDWEMESILSFSGFLNGVNFEINTNERMCFCAFNKNHLLEGILVVTPIGTTKKWFFEDLIIRSSNIDNRGIGELLTLTALESLQNQDATEVSLGVVSLTQIETTEFGEHPPVNFMRILKGIQLASALFYNAGGIELFRRRFKVERWNKIYLSIKEDHSVNTSSTLQWIFAIAAILASFKPVVHLSAKSLLRKIYAPIRKHPTSLGYLIFSLVIYFASIENKWVNDFFAQNFEFSLDASLWQWPFRTLTSEIIYFSRTQFELFTGIIFTLLFFIEKKIFDKKWASFLLGVFLCLDVVARTLTGFVYRKIYHSISLLTLLKFFPMNGGETLLSSLLGFIISLSGNRKDEWFAYGLLGIIGASLILPAFGMTSLAVLYCSAFYVGGYLIGKSYLKYQSQKDAKINKHKKEKINSAELS